MSKEMIAEKFTEDKKDATVVLELKRVIGLPTAVSLIVGGIIGSGIFISPQGVLIGAGSFGWALVIWALCGVLSLCGALVFAELGVLIPKSGGTYYYFKEFYGDWAAFVYLFGWAFFVLPSSLAIVALTCSEYLTQLFFNDGCGSGPQDVQKMLATALIICVAGINCRSVSLSGSFSIVFTISKLVVLAIIILGGLVKLAQGYSSYLSPDNSFDGTSWKVADISIALLNGMWAYSGWDSLNYLSEELVNPARTIPLALFISVPLITGVYMLTNVAYFSVLSPEEVLASPAVALTWAEVVIPAFAWIVPLGVAISTFGGASGAMLFSPRLLFVGAREKHLMSFLSMIHVNNHTPVPAILLLTVLSVAFTYMGSITQLIGYTGIVIWLFYGMVGVELICLRYTWKDTPRAFTAPLICPVVLIVFSLLLFIGPLVGNPDWGYLFALGLLVLGFVLWLVLIKYRRTVSCLDHVTMVLQLFLQVSPLDEPDLMKIFGTDSQDTNSDSSDSSVTKF